MAERKIVKGQAPIPGLRKLRVNACWAAFESGDGRSIPTEQIEPGLFWRMYDFMNALAARLDGTGDAEKEAGNRDYADGFYAEAEAIRAFLDSLKVQQEGDGT